MAIGFTVRSPTKDFSASLYWFLAMLGIHSYYSATVLQRIIYHLHLAINIAAGGYCLYSLYPTWSLEISNMILETVLAFGAFFSSVLMCYYFISSKKLGTLISELGYGQKELSEARLWCHRLTLITFSWMIAIGCIPDSVSYYFALNPKTGADYLLVLLFAYSDFILNMASVASGMVFSIICTCIIIGIDYHIQQIMSSPNKTMDPHFFYHNLIRKKTLETTSLWQYSIMATLFFCTSQLLLYFYNFFSADQSQQSHIAFNQMTSFIQQTLMVSTPLVAAAMVTTKGDRIIQTVAQLRGCKVESSKEAVNEDDVNNNVRLLSIPETLFYPAFSNEEIAQFVLHASVVKIEVQIFGVTINFKILTTLYYTIVSVLLVVFKDKINNEFHG